MAEHTPGPWRWELSMQSKNLHLVGGRPKYDLTIMDFCRWGMGGATVNLRDTAHDGMNIMHKLHNRPDWIAKEPGREHHANWFQRVVHPDMLLIEAAPDLLAALEGLVEANTVPGSIRVGDALDSARTAIARARGEQHG